MPKSRPTANFLIASKKSSIGSRRRDLKTRLLCLPIFYLKFGSFLTGTNEVLLPKFNLLKYPSKISLFTQHYRNGQLHTLTLAHAQAAMKKLFLSRWRNICKLDTLCSGKVDYFIQRFIHKLQVCSESVLKLQKNSYGNAHSKIAIGLLKDILRLYHTFLRDIQGVQVAP
jgi:hypothetical protein